MVYTVDMAIHPFLRIFLISSAVLRSAVFLCKQIFKNAFFIGLNHDTELHSTEVMNREHS